MLCSIQLTACPTATPTPTRLILWWCSTVLQTTCWSRNRPAETTSEPPCWEKNDGGGELSGKRKIRQEKKQGADDREKEKRQDGVVKVKPHVCKRSLTSASALYSFLTAARIPAVGPGTERRGGGGLWWTPQLLHPQEQKNPERRGRLWSNTGILFIIFSQYFIVFLFLKSR